MAHRDTDLIKPHNYIAGGINTRDAGALLGINDDAMIVT